MPSKNRYVAIIERIFSSKYRPGARELEFTREELSSVADELDVQLPSNPGDILYTFRSLRSSFPQSIKSTAGRDEAWLIRLAGRGKYRFVLTKDLPITPNLQMVTTKIPDATPGIIAKYALNDEQALLAKVRYNRLLDVFTGVTCYSLQNHLRTTVPNVGQIETDELYVGVDKHGTHYVLPVQAKGGRDKLGIVQIEQDLALCAAKYPHLVPRAIACQFLANEVIAMFEFAEGDAGVGVVTERHYVLVPPEEIGAEELARYSQSRLSE